MAVDIVCSPTPKWRDADHSVSVYLDESAEYGFLCPYFEKAEEKIGYTIDLYDSCTFYAEQLEILKDVLVEARSDCLSRPEQWEQPVTEERGNPLVPRQVQRVVVCALIDALLNLIDRAIKDRLYVICFGD